MSTLTLIDPKLIEESFLQEYDEIVDVDTCSSLTIELNDISYDIESPDIIELPRAPLSITSLRIDDKFEYIGDELTRIMLINAWQAINQTDALDFIAEDTDNFMFSTDERVLKILEKMEELGYHGHSGCSFGITLRNIQYLIKNGEEEFKKLFT